MNIITIVIVLCAFLNGLKGQAQDFFGFDRVKDYKDIVFNDISVNNSLNLYENINLIKEPRNSLKPGRVEVKLSNEVELYHSCFNYLTDYDSSSNCEYIKFYDSLICIDEVLNNNINKLKTVNTRLVFNKAIYSFNYNNKQYILLGASDREFFRNIDRNYWILFEIDFKKVKNVYSFVDGYSDSPKCFGDFNNDGQLDYLNWYFNKNKIVLYSLDGDKFLPDKSVFFYVDPSVEEKERVKNGEFVTYSILNRKKSKLILEF